MESMGVYLKEDWEYSLSKMFTDDDEQSDCMLHFLQNFGAPSDFLVSGEASRSVAVSDEESLYCSYENPNTNLYLISQETSASNYTNTSACFPNPCNDSYNFSDYTNLTPLMMNDMNIVHDQSMYLSGSTTTDEETSDFLRGDCNVMQDVLCFKEENKTEDQGDGCTDLGLKRKFEVAQLSETVKHVNTSSAGHPKKKCRVPRDTPKNKRYVETMKNQKFIKTDINVDGEISRNVLSSSTSTYSSEDDSNASQELNGGSNVIDTNTPAVLNSSGKSRANRGAATDPQSLYARKRRERINERLRILQHLVPNGTKVDISTMLEEAVQYVKFLQLQIKLLSSDDTWMYAPIAYNGMDMGLYQNISSPAI